MKKIFVLLSILIFCFSCATQKKEIITKSTIKLGGENTKIRNLIDIDGVYSDATYATMFFEDGTYVNFFLDKDEIEKGEIHNLSKSIQYWEEDGKKRWGYNWGVYSIKNDTIIVYMYDKGNWLKSWTLSERRYKVINRQTIQNLYYIMKTEAASEWNKTRSPWIDSPTLHFTPADSLPSSDCWLKENKWIWNNEFDWRTYMQKQSKKKNSN